MPALSNDTDLLREAWAVLSAASEELIRFHKEEMPVLPDEQRHGEWEACGCEVAVTIREMTRAERKLYTELERRGVFSPGERNSR